MVCHVDLTVVGPICFFFATVSKCQKVRTQKNLSRKTEISPEMLVASRCRFVIYMPALFHLTASTSPHDQDYVLQTGLEVGYFLSGYRLHSLMLLGSEKEQGSTHAHSS
jgi:hypothetical protein